MDYSFPFLKIVLIAILFFSSAKNEAREQLLPSGCRLIWSKTIDGNWTMINKLKYDSLGREVLHEYYFISSTNPRIDTTIEENKYDNDGYLVERKWVGKLAPHKSPNVGVTKFEYSINRLIKATSFDQSSNVTSFKAYQYDDSGHLIQCIHQLQSQPNSFVYLYKGGKQIDYFTTTPSGKIERAYLFENGRRSAFIDEKGNITTKFSFDNQGRISRSESYQDGRVTGYDEYEYIDGKHPSRIDYYPKGWPEEMRYANNGFSGNPGLRERTTSYLLDSTTGLFYKSVESTFIHSKNAYGLIDDSEAKSQSYTKDGQYNQFNQFSESFSYEGCP